MTVGNIVPGMTVRQDDTGLELLSTGAAAKLIGVSLKALHRYEEQGLISTIRTPGGHRRWVRKDVEALMTRAGDAA
jgi:predicted site-specific integrase-resolvase